MLKELKLFLINKVVLDHLVDNTEECDEKIEGLLELQLQQLRKKIPKPLSKLKIISWKKQKQNMSL